MAEKIVIDLDFDVKGSEVTLGQLEKRAELLNEELRKVPQGSKAFKELRQELVKTNKEIKNTELAMESLDNEQVASELGSVAGAVGDVTAAFILLGGDEDSAIGETAKRIETALGVTMAFKGSIEGIISFQKLWNNTLKQTAVIQAVYNAGQKAMAFVTSATTQATKLLRIAMLSLPFVAIGTAVGLLVANFKDIMKSFGFFNAEAEALNETMDEFRSGSEDATKKVMEMNATFKLARKGVLDKKEALDKYNKEFGKTLGTAKSLNEAERIFREKSGAYIQSVALRKQADAMLTIAAEKQVEAALAKTEENLGVVDYAMTGVIGQLFGTTNAMNFMAERSKANTKEIEKDAEKQAKLTEGLAQDLLMQAAEVEQEFEIISEESTEFHEKQANKRKEILARQKKAFSDLVIANLQARAEDEKDEKAKAVTLMAIEQQKFKEILRLDKAKKRQDRMTDEENALAVFEYQQRIDKIKEDFAQKEIERERKRKQNLQTIEDDFRAELEAETEIYNQQFLKQQQIERQAVEDKYFRLIELAKEYGENITTLETNRRNELAKIDKQYNQEAIEDDQALQDAKLNAAKGLIAGLSEVAGQNEKFANALFVADKALAIGEILINLQREISGYMANPTWTIAPDGGAVVKTSFITAAKIRAATSIASIVASSIAKFKGGGGGSIGGGVGGGSIAGAGATAPSLSPITNTSTLVPQEPQQVFVTETDITNVQNQVAVIETQATIK